MNTAALTAAEYACLVTRFDGLTRLMLRKNQ